MLHRNLHAPVGGEREREREREREHQCFPAQTKRERKLTLLLQLADFIVDVVVRAPV